MAQKSCFLPHVILALVAFQLCLTAAPASGFDRGTEAELEVVDAFKIFAGFAEAVAVRDVSRDPKFKCASAVRIEFDPAAPSATYRWSLNVSGDEDRKHPVVKFTNARTPDRVYGVINSDESHRQISRFLYSDYETCGVLKTHLFGYECVLFVVPEKKDSVPSNCLEMHAELCGKGVSLYNKDLCNTTHPQ